ncbi:MAG: hypothetical protein JSW39_22280 [Desulfobacterales bacterium]|nr:MAG: hypothetical protein JSW39_22280 [Desulfobacterales bacterium]
MDRNRWRRNKTIPRLQSQALVLSMAALLGGVGWLLGGRMPAFFAVGATIFLYYANPVFSPAVMLRTHRARRLLTMRANKDHVQWQRTPADNSYGHPDVRPFGLRLTP